MDQKKKEEFIARVQAEEKRKGKKGQQAQEWLDENYPTSEIKQATTVLNDFNKWLNGKLDLSEFPNLEELDCKNTSSNYGRISEVDLSKCPKLTKLSLKGLHQLKKLDLSNNCELTFLKLNHDVNIETHCDINILHLTKLTACETDYPLVKFQWYLLQNPDKKGDLAFWPQFINCLRIKKNNWVGWKVEIATAYQLICDQELEDWEKYYNILKEWAKKEQSHNNDEIENIYNFFILVQKSEQSYKELLTELSNLKQEKQSLDNKLADHDQTLTDLRINLEQLTQAEQELTSQKKELTIEVKRLTRVNNLLTHKLEITKASRQARFEEWLQENSELNQRNNDLALKSHQKQKELKAQIKAKEEELAKLQEQQQDKLASIAQLQDQLNSLQEQLKSKEGELAQLRDQTTISTASLRKEIELLKGELKTVQSEKDKQTTDWEAQIQTVAKQRATLEEELASARQQYLDEVQKSTNLESELNSKDNKIQELEAQVTALALSSGLLSQQLEDLTRQLTSAQQETERKKLELEIKENLLKEKDNSLSEQEQQIANYQSLLRRSEEQLSDCQRIITKKSEKLTKLEEEKNKLAELLEQSEEKIGQLENSLLNSANKISELESKIKDLEQNNPHSQELVSLKAELATLKSNSQKEIKDLKSCLQSAKLKEESLNQKIKELNQKPKINTEEVVADSFWERVKTPLFYGGAIMFLILFISWTKNKFKLNN